ncbi:MAG: hypothetical protein AAFW69_00490 [Pseudomonadota bacterium]
MIPRLPLALFMATVAAAPAPAQLLNYSGEMRLRLAVLEAREREDGARASGRDPDCYLTHAALLGTEAVVRFAIDFEAQPQPATAEILETEVTLFPFFTPGVWRGADLPEALGDAGIETIWFGANPESQGGPIGVVLTLDETHECLLRSQPGGT